MLTCSGRTVPKKHTTFGCLRAARPAASCSISSTATWEAASGAPDRKTEDFRHVTTTSLLFHAPTNSCKSANTPYWQPWQMANCLRQASWPILSSTPSHYRSMAHCYWWL